VTQTKCTEFLRVKAFSTYLEFIMKYSVVTTKFVFVFVNLFESSYGNHAKLYENVV
jgi:hypothetical protein